jgi:hypothetical protein
VKAEGLRTIRRSNGIWLSYDLEPRAQGKELAHPTRLARDDPELPVRLLESGRSNVKQ